MLPPSIKLTPKLTLLLVGTQLSRLIFWFFYFSVPWNSIGTQFPVLLCANMNVLSSICGSNPNFSPWSPNLNSLSFLCGPSSNVHCFPWASSFKCSVLSLWTKFQFSCTFLRHQIGCSVLSLRTKFQCSVLSCGPNFNCSILLWYQIQVFCSLLWTRF